jgi:riboflavin kinase/FMN adenylyltransferase
VGGTKRVIEVNIFDFDRSIYGATLRVFVKKFLRPEIKFDGLKDLVKQIDQDKLDSLAIL